jgi:CRISPR-associated protein Cmr1
MRKTELTYQVSFNTPAFLGNAEQQAQWRTPPFKAMLRQWWRVVKAPDVGYDHRRLLTLENELFGSAGDDDGGGRSQVQLRLSGWDMGSLVAGRDSVELKYVDHPDVDPRAAQPHRGEKKVRADVYLGYGPIGKSSAIDAIAEPQTFKLRSPTSEAPTLRKAMQLAAWFGTLGSRARNGWGSLHIEGEGILGWAELCDSKLAEQAPLRSVTNALGDRLASEWPHAVGLCADGRPAVWRVVAGSTVKEGKTAFVGFDNWRLVMEQLAALKIGFRTQFKLNSGAPHSRVEDRHILAYPVTNHGLAGLPNARLASQMRFKVAKSKDGKYFGLITHLPSAMPRAFFERSTVRPPEIKDQIAVWQQVHDFLNTQSPSLLNRIRKG